jgi:hypothetical protein
LIILNLYYVLNKHFIDESNRRESSYLDTDDDEISGERKSKDGGMKYKYLIKEYIYKYIY